ncbi:MAG TPA: Na(+)/H(+) antiporter subunit B [Hyphomicrobiales bacterium]|nr:Na(+)/H(+) antiporter subunit B [Hyphomicrobiales bacterium]
MRHHLILRIITKLLIAPILLFALYVQFHGEIGPGGGFQAGVITAAAIILYGLVFGLEAAERAVPPSFVYGIMVSGVLIYAGTGAYSMAVGGQFLDYDMLDPHHPVHGQHLGIILVEVGVLFTVSATMILIFYAFAGRPTPIGEEDW